MIRGRWFANIHGTPPPGFEQALADQDWISFRPNVFALQDLATKWIEIIKARLAEAQRADTVTEHIHQVLAVVVVVVVAVVVVVIAVRFVAGVAADNFSTAKSEAGQCHAIRHKRHMAPARPFLHVSPAIYQARSTGRRLVRGAQELERMRKATPALKYCRGEPFKEEHWSALLQVGVARTHLCNTAYSLRDVHPFQLERPS